MTLDELVERAKQSGEAFQIGHRALMAMQERAEAAEARVATIEAALRELVRLAGRYEEAFPE